MSISFYYAPLCPRCASTRSHLQELLGESYSQAITEVNTVREPLAAWNRGVRMVSALYCNGDILSGVVLPREPIQAFLEKHRPAPGVSSTR